MIFLVSCQTSQVAVLQKALAEAFPQFHFFTKVTSKEAAQQERGILYRFTLTAADQPHLVRDMTGAFLACGLSIRNLQTELTSAPMAGYPLLLMRADLTVHHKDQLRNLRKALDKFEDDLDVEISLKSVGGSTEMV